jgi:hypothetical protein
LQDFAGGENYSITLCKMNVGHVHIYMSHSIPLAFFFFFSMAWSRQFPNMDNAGEFEEVILKGNFFLKCGFLIESSDVLEGR